MTLVWTFCALLILVAMLFVVWPLWRKSAFNNDVLRDAANLGILRDQSSEMEVDLQNGLLTQDAYEQGKRELQGRLIDEVKITEQPAIKPPRNPAKTLAITGTEGVFIFTLSRASDMASAAGFISAQWKGALTGKSIARLAPLALAISQARSTADLWPEMTT